MHLRKLCLYSFNSLRLEDEFCLLPPTVPDWRGSTALVMYTIILLPCDGLYYIGHVNSLAFSPELIYIEHSSTGPGMHYLHYVLCKMNYDIHEA